MTAIRVRAQEPGDVEAWAEIMMSPAVLIDTTQIPYRSVDWWSARLTSEPETYRLVADRDGQVVGGLTLRVETSPRRRHAGSFGIMVREGFQGQGVGTALMAAMIDLADNWLGVRRIELQVYTGNTGAVHLYEKFGFVIEGTALQVFLRDGIFADAYMMARLRL